MKQLSWLFYPSTMSPERIGLKFCLIAVTDNETPPVTAHDWGFASWDGENWEELPGIPEGWSAKVVWWSETLQPSLLIAEQPKIITMGGLN